MDTIQITAPQPLPPPPSRAASLPAHAPARGDAGHRVALAINAVALSIAIGVLIALPLSWFVFGYHYHQGDITAELRGKAAEVEMLVARYPDIWPVQTARHIDILGTHDTHHLDDKLRLYDAFGRLIAEEDGKPDPAWPVLRISMPVHDDAQQVVASMQSELSIRGLIQETAVVAMVAALLSMVIFWICRTLPLRVIHRSLSQARFLASHDALTGLANRRLFLDRVATAADQVARYGESAAVLLINLDHFKDINDTLGHGAGDRLLQEAAQRMARCLRKDDTLARLGSDEFAIVIGGLRDPDAAGAVARRLLAAYREPFAIEGTQTPISVSIGITIVRGGASPVEAVLLQADLALYWAKAEGRGRYRFFEEEMHRRLQRRKLIERDLRIALEQGQFEVHYQPQVELSSERIVGAEALVRWRHPEQGLIAPGEFIDIAEETGLIGALGEWVLRRACEDATAWAPLRIAVNLSPVQFRQPGLAERIAAILAQTGFDPRRLELEITEGVLLSDTEATLGQLRQLKAMGICLAMDDFGTGYSSLAYLNRFPFDKLKIDRCFVTELESSGSAAAIVRAVVALARSFSMRSNAEGVETLAQAQRLRLEGCHEAQGWLFGRPMPAAELQALLRKAGALTDAAPDVATRSRAAPCTADPALPPKR